MEKIDRFSIAILEELQTDARISNAKLSEKIGLSKVPCWRRVKDLQRSGAIRGYTAIVDPSKVGLDITAIVHVTLESHSSSSIKRFADRIADVPEILECLVTTGEFDYMLKVVVPDIASIQHFLRNVLMEIPGVRRVNTGIVTDTIKQTTNLPLETLLAPGQ